MFRRRNVSCFSTGKDLKLKKLRIGSVSGALDMFVEVFFLREGEEKFEVNLARMKREREKEREEESLFLDILFVFDLCLLY